VARSRFSFRALTSLVLFWAYLSLVFSGVVLYIAPKGRIANWTDWRLLALAKDEWAAIHTLMALLFLVGGLFHLFKFNRHVIWAYVRRSREEASPFRWAVIGSVVVFAVFLVGTLINVQPFAAVMDVSELFRNGLLASDTSSPPTPHLEELTLAQLAGQLGLDPSDACDTLRTYGLSCDDPSATLLQIARDNGASPNEVYAKLRPAPAGGQRDSAHPSTAGGARGAGWGRPTVAEVAAQQTIPASRAIDNLRRHGIDATADETVRDVAVRHGLRPADLPAMMSSETP